VNATHFEIIFHNPQSRSGHTALIVALKTMDREGDNVHNEFVQQMALDLLDSGADYRISTKVHYILWHD
jgi:hypothetical protein